MTQRKDNQSETGINTRLVQGLTDPMDRHGFIHPPVYRGSTVLYPDVASMRGERSGQKYTYGTITPTTDILCGELNDLEGAAHTVLTPNGLSAISVPLLTFLSAGDHLLVVDTCYYPTRRFCDNVLAKMGVDIEYYRPDVSGNITHLIKPNTRVVFTEAPGSNTFEMQDVPTIAKAVKALKADIVVMMDNTWATPLYFRPLDHGVDVSIHALTKYPGGHSDLLLGGVSVTEAYKERLAFTYNALGMCVGADEVQLVLRGLKTLGLRLRRHEQSALEIASWMQAMPQFATVMHPALPDDPGHAIWKRDFCGAGGLFGARLATLDFEKAAKFAEALQHFGLGYSWGGHESLIVLPEFEGRTVSKPDSGGVIIRLQIGLEDVKDLKADIEQALAAAGL